MAESGLGHGPGQGERVAAQRPYVVEVLQPFGEFCGGGEVVAGA
ncbi:hypothetical protein AB0I51_12145 [Streptomyces sp. NPDC050549]